MGTQPVEVKQGDAIRPVGTATLGDVVVQTFLDTESAVSIIAEDVFRWISQQRERRPLYKKWSISTRDIPVLELALIPVEGGDKVAEVPMNIQRNAERHCLLGAQASWALQLLQLTSTVKLKRPSGANGVHLITECRILSQHVTWARVKLDGEWPRTKN